MVIYFDHNATTCPVTAVVHGMSEVLHIPFNASSIHKNGREARNIVENARTKVRQTFNVPKNYRVMFTCSATEANNTVIKSARTACYKIYASAIEHPSVMQMKPDVLLPINAAGELCLTGLERCCDNSVTDNMMLSVMMANNETGVIQPIDDVVRVAKRYGALLHVDAAQAPGKIDLDITKLEADVVTISAHKFGGPQGVGCIIYNTDTFKIAPLITGGGQEYGLRSGTENIAAIHGLSVACDFVVENIKIMQNKIAQIRNYIEEQIVRRCHRVIIFGGDARNRLPNTISIMMPYVKSEVQVAYFDANGVAVSAGSACSAGRVENPYVQMAMGYSYDESSCALRVSLGIDNTSDEAKFFIEKWIALYARAQH